MNTIKEALMCSARQYGGSAAVQYINADREVVVKTYEDLKRDSELIAFHLLNLGYRKRKVAILGDNSY